MRIREKVLLWILIVGSNMIRTSNSHAEETCPSEFFSISSPGEIKVMSFNLLYEAPWFFFKGDFVEPETESCLESSENCGATRLGNSRQQVEMVGWRKNFLYLTEDSNSEKRWENRRLLVGQLLDQANADILGLVEVFVGPIQDFIEGRYTCDGCEYRKSHAMFGRREKSDNPNESKFGFYILYKKNRFVEIENGVILVDDDAFPRDRKSIAPLENRPAVWVKLKDTTTGRVFVAVVAHASPISECYRLRYAATLVQKVRGWLANNVPVIVMGDFNTFKDKNAPLRCPNGWSVSDAEGIDAEINTAREFRKKYFDYSKLLLHDSGEEDSPSDLAPSARLYESVMSDSNRSLSRNATTVLKLNTEKCDHPGGMYSCVEEKRGQNPDRIFVTTDFEIHASAILNCSSQRLLQEDYMCIDEEFDGVYSCMLKDGKCIGCSPKKKVYASDHYPVVARLSLVKSEEPPLKSKQGFIPFHVFKASKINFRKVGSSIICEIAPSTSKYSIGQDYKIGEDNFDEPNECR